MLSGNNGILQKSTEAKRTTERAEAKEQAQMDIMAYIADKTANHEDASLDDSRVKTILTGKSYVKNGQPGNESFITTKGEYEIPYSEIYTASDTLSTATLPTGTYTAGQEVTFGGEQFFVLGDDGNTVRLLAKYCLKRMENKQSTRDATTSDYGITFSNTKYWSNINGITYPYNLQSTEGLTQLANTSEEDSSNNAIIKAQEYGTSKGVVGRLMTKEEIDAIYNGSDSTMKNILFGRWDEETKPIEGYLKFWIGYSQYADWIQYVDGTQSNPRNGKYGDATYGWNSTRCSTSINCT